MWSHRARCLNRLKRGGLALGLLLLAGCGEMTTRVHGLRPMNLTDENQSAPVDVRFFQLSDDDRFRRAPFDALWLDPAKVLGSDLVEKPLTITVHPAASGDDPREVVLGPRHADARFLGVMALYRKADGSPRTLVLPISEADAAILDCSGYGLRLRGAAGPQPAQTVPIQEGEQRRGEAADPAPRSEPIPNQHGG